MPVFARRYERLGIQVIADFGAVEPNHQAVRAHVVARHADDRLDVRLQQVRSADLVEAVQDQVEHGPLSAVAFARQGGSLAPASSQPDCSSNLTSSRPGPTVGHASSTRTRFDPASTPTRCNGVAAQGGLPLTYASSSRRANRPIASSA